jgi:hypothetical protein
MVGQGCQGESFCFDIFPSDSIAVRNLAREVLVEAAGVEPASENVTGQENYMLIPVHASGLRRKRSRTALRTDKKRVPLA